MSGVILGESPYNLPAATVLDPIAEHGTGFAPLQLTLSASNELSRAICLTLGYTECSERREARVAADSFAFKFKGV